MLPEVSVDLLGPISSLKGHAWPRGYDWVHGRQNQLVSMTAADTPHELVIRLPSGRTIRHLSRATFFSQERSTVIEVSLMPHPGLLRYQDVITLLEAILQKWDAEPDDRSKKSLAHWKTEGDLQSWDIADRSGSAILRGEGKVGIFFRIRPSKGGWFLVLNVAAPWEQVRRILGLPEPPFKATEPTTRPSDDSR